MKRTPCNLWLTFRVAINGFWGCFLLSVGGLGAITVNCTATNIVSRPVGFVRVVIPPGSQVLAAIPFDAFTNSINHILQGQLTGATNETLADHIFKWDPYAQVYLSAFKAGGLNDPARDGFWFEDDLTWVTSRFLLNPGDAFWIENRQVFTQNAFLVGSVLLDSNRMVSLYEGINLFSYPFSTRKSLNASSLAADGALGALEMDNADTLTELVSNKTYWLLDNIASTNHHKWLDESNALSEMVFSVGRGYWYDRAVTNPLNWKEIRPYENSFGQIGLPPQIIGSLLNSTGDEITLTVGTSSGATEKLEVFYQDLAADGVFNSTDGWAIAALDLSVSGQGQINWTDTGAGNRGKINTVSARFYLVGRGDVNSDGDSVPDAREIYIHHKSPTTKDNYPYGGTNWPVPGRIQAEDFDTGGTNVAYYDSIVGNSGGKYRTSESVDIYTTQDQGNGYNVKCDANSEWMKYTFEVVTAGVYDVALRVATTVSGRQARVWIDGVDISGIVTLPYTASQSCFEYALIKGVSLAAGVHVMRLDTVTSSFYLNWIDIGFPGAVGQDAQSPFGGANWPVPGIIQAEDFDEGGSGVAYRDTIVGNSGGKYRTNEFVDIYQVAGTTGVYSVYFNADTEWLEYTIQAANATTYDLILRMATPNTNTQARIWVDGTNVSGTVSLPSTGGWTVYQDVALDGFSMSAGKHILRVEAVKSAFYLNYLSCTGRPSDEINLRLSSGNLSFSDDQPGVNEEVTVTTRVDNAGLGMADNVLVNLLVDGCVVTNGTISSLAGGESGSLAFTLQFTNDAVHVITAVADPEEILGETDEADNQGSRLLAVGNPGINARILVQANAPGLQRSNSVLWITGQAIYEIPTDSTTNYYPVEGGLVAVQIETGAVYSTVHTDINGYFSQALVTPELHGQYRLYVTVTDESLIGQDEVSLLVGDIPPPDTWNNLQMRCDRIGAGSGIFSVGQSTSISVSVFNAGNRAASNVVVELYDVGARVASDTIALIPPETDGSVSLAYTVPASSNTWRVLRAVVVPQADESNPFDNEATRLIRVGNPAGAVQIVTHNLSVPAQLHVGQGGLASGLFQYELEIDGVQTNILLAAGALSARVTNSSHSAHFSGARTDALGNGVQGISMLYPGMYQVFLWADDCSGFAESVPGIGMITVVATMAIETNVPRDGLRLWLKANDMSWPDGLGVGMWLDASGQEHDLTQIAYAARPVFHAQELNGLPVVHFDGTNDFIAGNLDTLIAPLTLVIVSRFGYLQQPADDHDCVLRIGNGSMHAQHVSISRRASNTMDESNNVYYSWLGATNACGPVLTGQQWIVTTVIHATNVPRHNLFQNGKAKTVEDYTQSVQLNGAMELGRFANGELTNHYFNGDIAEVLVYESALSESQRHAVEGYLGTKYGLSVTTITDVDEDGMADDWEQTFLGNLDQPANGDTDDDGLDNLAEFLANTDPENPDTDDDSFLDGDEVAFGSQANDPDSEPSAPVRILDSGRIFADFQTALAASHLGDTVAIQQGRHLLSTTIVMPSGVKLCGGYDAGWQRTGTPGTTILDGQNLIRCILLNDLAETAELANLTLENGAADNGGGICIMNAAATITDCTIVNSIASAEAGGVWIKNGSVRLQYCRIMGCQADSGGGLFLRGHGSVTLRDCTLLGNSARIGGAGSMGGGIQLSLDNCLIALNHSDLNAGFDARDYFGVMQCHTCTVIGNTDVNHRSGTLQIQQRLGIPPRFTHCILWNPGSDCEFDHPPGTIIDVRYSIVHGGHPGIGNINADPLCADPDNGDAHLLSVSPAVDAGSQAAADMGLDWNLGYGTHPDGVHGDSGVLDIGYHYQGYSSSSVGGGAP